MQIHDLAAFIPLELPSRGIPYPKGALPDGRVEIRAMCGSEEAVLRSPALDNVTKMERILSACMRFPKPTAGQPLTPRDLTASDQFMAIMAIRTESLGATYNVTTKCDSCGTEFTTPIDFKDALKVEEMPRTKTVTDGDKTSEETLTYDPAEGIAVVLPKSRLELKIRLLTGKDSEYIARESSSGKSKIIPPSIAKMGNSAWYLTQALAIKAVKNNGEWEDVNHSNPSEMSTLMMLVSKLPILDLNHIDRVYSDYDVSIDNSTTVACTSCGSEQEVSVALTPEFFRPTNV